MGIILPYCPLSRFRLHQWDLNYAWMRRAWGQEEYVGGSGIGIRVILMFGKRPRLSN